MSETRRGDICGTDNCRSSRWTYIDAGEEICENGHARQRANPDTEPDDNDFQGAVSGKTTRKEKVVTEKVAKHLSGREAFDLHLLCFQLILRKQVWWLVHEKQLPPELETIVHDLWALRLEQLASLMEYDPLSDSESQRQAYSSQTSQSDIGATTDPSSEEGRPGPALKSSSTPKLIQSLALCYMGIYLLRTPILLGDVFQWVQEGNLLYYRAIKALPKSMTDRLPAAYQVILGTQSILSAKELHRAVTATFLQYQREYDIVLPTLNFNQHLLRYIQELALPIDLYPLVKRVSWLGPFDSFRYPREMKGKRLRITDFPEGQFVAALIIAVKIVHPFDSVKRYPLAADDIAGAVIDWGAWVKAHEAYEAALHPKGRLDWETAMKTTEDDVVDMSDTKIDDYLDYYTKTWALDDPDDKEKDAAFRQTLLNMFPITSTTKPLPKQPDVNHLKTQKIKDIQAYLLPRRVITKYQEVELGKAVHRPGSLYKRYRKESDLEGHAKDFYQAVADLAGLSLKTVVRAVYIIERHVQKGLEREELLAEDKAEDDEDEVMDSD